MEYAKITLFYLSLHNALVMQSPAQYLHSLEFNKRFSYVLNVFFNFPTF